jgi:WD40 repeat protein
MIFEVKNVEKLIGHKGAIYKIIISRYRNILYSTGGDGWVVKWDFLHSKEGILIAKDEDNIFALSELNEETLLAGTLQGNLLIINTVDKFPRKLKLHRHAIYDILLVHDKVYTVGADGLLNELSAKDLRVLNTYRISMKALRKAIVVDGSQLYIASSDGKIYVFNTLKNTVDQILDQNTDKAIFSLAEYHQQQKIISGSMDAHLRIWDLNSKSLQKTIPAHLYTINDVLIDPLNKLLFSAGRDKHIKVWAMEDMSLLKVIDFHKFKAHTHSVNTLCLYSKENILLSAGDDREIIKIQYQSFL